MMSSQLDQALLRESAFDNCQEIQRSRFAHLEKLIMFNPLLNELVAREQLNDRLRQAEQSRLAKLAIRRQPADRFNLRRYIGNRLLAVRHMFKLNSMLIASSPCSAKHSADE
jgi:hypothetical protein